MIGNDPTWDGVVDRVLLCQCSVTLNPVPRTQVLCQQAEFVKKVSKSAMSTLKLLFALSACGLHSRKGN